MGKIMMNLCMKWGTLFSDAPMSAVGNQPSLGSETETVMAAFAGNVGLYVFEDLLFSHV
jgi:hypothetical protein